jgi:hypothetical protein
VFDWYQGKISSRRLLVLIQHLPESSAFKTAYRDGDWSLQSTLTTGMWNEIKAMRGDLWAFLGHEHLSFHPVLPPSALQQQEEKRAQVRAAHDGIMAQLRGC